MSIKFGNYPIEVDGSTYQRSSNLPDIWGAGRNVYEGQVLAILGKIANNRIGQILLNTLPKSKKLKIIPFSGNACTAVTNLDESETGSEIQYSPESFKSGTTCNPDGQKRRFGMNTDEVLVHELAHANRQLRGKWEDMKIPAKEGFDYENIEDFFAITLANVYSSSIGKTELRRDHAKPTGEGKMPDNASTSYGFLFYPSNFEYMKYLWLKDNGIFVQIANLKHIKFNPFTEFQRGEQRKN